jgi:hypothetical protein
MNQWIAFIKGEGNMPREIDNTNIRNYIVKWRNSQTENSIDDTRMEIKKG